MDKDHIKNIERYSKEWFRMIKKTSRVSARRSKLPWDLKSDDIKTLFENSGNACHYCGRTEDESEASFQCRLTLDRDIPSLGYTRGNVLLACKPCNEIKSKWLTSADMLKIAPIIRESIDRRSL